MMIRLSAIFIAFIAASQLLTAPAAAQFWVGSDDPVGVATQPTLRGLFGLYPSTGVPDGPKKRIFSAPGSKTVAKSVLLTVSFDSWGSQIFGRIDLIVNDVVVETIYKVGYDTRTFLLKNVRTIDLHQTNTDNAMTGVYQISIRQ